MPTFKPTNPGDYLAGDLASKQNVEYMKGDGLSMLKKATERTYKIHDMQREWSDPAAKLSNMARYSGEMTWRAKKPSKANPNPK